MWRNQTWLSPKGGKEPDKVGVEGEGDQAVELDGLKILLVDPLIAERLVNAVLDFKDTPDGCRFTLDVF